MKKSQILCKIFLSIVVLLLYTVSNVVIVTAEKLPTFILYETLEKEILKVTVSVTPDSSSAGTIKMDYNKEHLIFKNIVANSENASSVLVNPDNKGLIALNFMNINGDLSGNTNLAVIEFILKSNEFSTTIHNLKKIVIYHKRKNQFISDFAFCSRK